MGGGGETDVQQVEAQDAWIFRRSLGHVRMANLIVYAKIAVTCVARSMRKRFACARQEVKFVCLRCVGKPGPKLRIVTSPLLNSSHRESSTGLELSNASSAWDKGHLRESGR